MTRIAAFRIKNDKDWQVELLAEAFAIARQAQLPYKLTQPASNEFIMFAKTIAELGMDRLSLQCAVINALLEIDPSRALALMREVDSQELPITKCEEAAAPNVDTFYQMLLTVAKRCFNSQQQEKGEDLAFLETYLRQVNHPAQVAPASRLVRFAGTTPERLDRLLNAFLAALDDVRHDDRVFSNGGNIAAAAELQMLGAFCSQYGKRGAEVFARVRRLLVEQLSGPRCTDNALTATGKPVPLPQAIRDFNQLIAFDDYKLEAITEAEIKPATLGGNAEIVRYWQTPKAARMKQRFYEVMFDHPQPRAKDADPNAPRVIIKTDPSSPERMQAFQQFFAELAAWEPEENVALTDFYHQKCLLYDEAFRRVPAGPLLMQVLRDYVNLLSASRAQFKSFPEWYAHFKSLHSGYVMAGVQGTVEATKEALQKSDDPFIQLFLRLSKAPADK